MRTHEAVFRSIARRLTEVEKLIIENGNDNAEALESVRLAITDCRKYFGPLIAEEIEINEWDKSPLNK